MAIRGQTKIRNISGRLRDLGFATRKVNPLIAILEGEGFVTVADLRKTKDHELLAIRGVGPAAVAALRGAIL